MIFSKASESTMSVEIPLNSIEGKFDKEAWLLKLPWLYELHLPSRCILFLSDERKTLPKLNFPPVWFFTVMGPIIKGIAAIHSSLTPGIFGCFSASLPVYRICGSRKKATNTWQDTGFCSFSWLF